MDPGATSLVVPDDNPIKSKYDGHMNDSDPFYLQDEDPESLEPDPILDRSKPKTPSSNIAQFTQSKSKLPEQYDVIANQINSLPSKRLGQFIGRVEMATH